MNGDESRNDHSVVAASVNSPDNRELTLPWIRKRRRVTGAKWPPGPKPTSDLGADLDFSRWVRLDYVHGSIDQIDSEVLDANYLIVGQGPLSDRSSMRLEVPFTRYSISIAWSPNNDVLTMIGTPGLGHANVLGAAGRMGWPGEGIGVVLCGRDVGDDFSGETRDQLADDSPEWGQGPLSRSSSW